MFNLKAGGIYNNNNNNNNGHSGGRGPWKKQIAYYAVWVCTRAGEKETQTQVLWELLNTCRHLEDVALNKL